MSLQEEFDHVWQLYPRKIAKLAAFKEYGRARQLDSFEHIVAGIEAYRQHLPEETRFIPHLRTFLSQGRWMDSYEVARPKKTHTNLYVPLRFRTGTDGDA